MKHQMKVKLSTEWIIDKIWVFTWMIFGGSITATYLSILNAIKEYRDQAFVLLFIVGCVVFLGIYHIFNKIRQHSIYLKSAQLSLAESHTNPLENEFDRKTIRVSDFFDHFYIGHKRKIFKRCRIEGPGLIYIPNSSLIDCHLKFCQIVIIKGGTHMTGVTIFESASMFNCEILNCTILLTRSEYDSISHLHEHVPVLNE